jgi:iron(III) transport system substrate-binding protein
VFSLIISADRGTHVNISGGGVVKTATKENKDAAIKFLEYLASWEGQDMFC